MRRCFVLSPLRFLRFAVLATAAVLVAGAQSAWAATLTVCPSGCQHTAIADALAAASDGDTIQIAAGTYAGGFIIDKDVSLVGAGAGQTTISGASPGVTVVMVDGATSAEVRRVTITGGTDRGVGVAGPNGELTIGETTVTGNAGGGLQSGGALLALEMSTVTNNSAGFGGGILVTFGTLRLDGSTITGNNETGSARGGGIHGNDGTTLLVVDSTVSNNNEDGIFGGGTLTVEGSTVSGNSGRGITFGGTGTALIADSVVRNHTAVNCGGGIQNGATMTMRRSTVSGNSTSTSGGGICNAGGGARTLTLENSTVGGNSAAFGGGVINDGGTVTLTKSTVSGNTASDRGGGFYNLGALTLDSSTVMKNSAGVDGGGIFNNGGTVTSTKSKVVKNTPNDCVGC